jgi:hypothetical protein
VRIICFAAMACHPVLGDLYIGLAVNDHGGWMAGTVSGVDHHTAVERVMEQVRGRYPDSEILIGDPMNQNALMVDYVKLALKRRP